MNRLSSSIALFTVIFFTLPSAATAAGRAESILAAAGTKGGLIVHLGCGDGKVTAALRTSNAYLVQGLDTNPAEVASAREHIRSLGLYGRVSVRTFDGQRLPYIDNLVNIIVVSNREGAVDAGEIDRVLAPRGIAFLPNTLTSLAKTLGAKPAGDGLVYRKPVPSAIDEWPHYLHSANGNPVADDDLVKPPRQLQWVASPKWSRHHEHMASMSALVSSRGKVFSICDDGPRQSMLFPPQWKLTARDAFNGLLLWQRPIPGWHNHLLRLKRGPASLPRRLVASDGRVYVTLGISAPVSILDANTGKTLVICEGTENTQELVLSEGVLFLVRGIEDKTAITAVDAETGNVLWEKPEQVTTFTLSVDAKRVVFFNGTNAVALCRADGSQLWTSEEIKDRRHATWLESSPPRLILDDRAVLVAPKNRIFAVSAEDGSTLWSAPHPPSGYVSPKDLFVIDGLVWCGELATGKSSGRLIGYDIMTGETKRSFLPDIDIIWLSHHRCHFSKATKNFILPGRMGVEFANLKTEKWKQHHWVRGGCIYGVMPCNGLLYTPPHSCACYAEAKQNGYSAYTSGSRSRQLPSSQRLEKGPAYGRVSLDENAVSAGDWPVFRHDSARSGHAAQTISTEVTKRWSTRLGGKLTQPVVAGGKLYVASVDQHTLHALNAETGKPVWRYTAGGRIDSPPSLYGGLAILGSRDGWIYCLRAADGELVWRYRAFPQESLVMVNGQLESAWPVHGSVLLENGEVHCVAGRNMFLEGGLRYLRLEPVTGSLISETLMDEEDPLRGGSIQQYDTWLDMTTTMPDVLSCDGQHIYMRSLPFDMQGKRRRITHIAEELEPAHLFSPHGFLEDRWFHRSYWTYARSFPGGWVGHLNAGRYNPSGRILAFDESNIYGYGRKPSYYSWITSLEYRFFAVDRKTHNHRDIYAYDAWKAAQVERFPKLVIDKQIGLPSGTGAGSRITYGCKWQNETPPLLAQAMVSVKEHLFFAGPKDTMDEKTYGKDDASAGFEQHRNELERQARIWNGEEGAILLAVSKKDGSPVSTYHLESLPVFDGMIAANGRLYMSLANGDIVCLE